jgi:hypothetical protein
VSELLDGALFQYDGHIWEKCGRSNFCLSEFDDQSEVMSHIRVQQWEVQPVERQEPWVSYQPHRQREKAFYDIRLRDGTVVECCWPNGVHWTPMKGPTPKKAGSGAIADYRVVQIRKCKSPMDRDDIK